MSNSCNFKENMMDLFISSYTNFPKSNSIESWNFPGLDRPHMKESYRTSHRHHLRSLVHIHCRIPKAPQHEQLQHPASREALPGAQAIRMFPLIQLETKRDVLYLFQMLFYRAGHRLDIIASRFIIHTSPSLVRARVCAYKYIQR